MRVNSLGGLGQESVWEDWGGKPRSLVGGLKNGGKQGTSFLGGPASKCGQKRGMSKQIGKGILKFVYRHLEDKF